jgi:hypothetical protein
LVELIFLGVHVKYVSTQELDELHKHHLPAQGCSIVTLSAAVSVTPDLPPNWAASDLVMSPSGRPCFCSSFQNAGLFGTLELVQTSLISRIDLPEMSGPHSLESKTAFTRSMLLFHLRLSRPSAARANSRAFPSVADSQKASRESPE